MNTITITSGTLKGAYALDYSYIHKTESGEDNVKRSCNTPVHEDLKKAFEDLIPHFAFICEEVEVSEVEDIIKNSFDENEDDDIHPIKQKFSVHSFKITGNGDNEGVVISGSKFLSIGKSVSITTPKLKWSDDDYKFIDELSEVVEVCKSEVNEYLNGKHAPESQLDIFNGFGDDVEVEITTTVD